MKKKERSYDMMKPSTGVPRRRRGEEGSTGRAWSDLPDGPLHSILTCLCSFVDFTAFSAVCRSWRAVALSLPDSLVTSLYPPLIVSPTFSIWRRASGMSSLRFSDPASPSFFASLSSNSGKFASFDFLSFSHGHLLRLSQNRVVVLNPFTGNELVSPVVPDVPKSYLNLFLLTSPPSCPDSALLLFTSHTLYYWKIRSSVSPAWSSYCPTVKPVGAVRIATVRGKVYVIDSTDTLFVLDLSPEFNLRPLAVEGIAEMNFGFERFLVDCGGELLCLLLVPNEEMISARLEVFRLDSSENRTRWVKKESLGNWAIFLGCNSRVLGLAVQNPERWGGKSNDVYFAMKNMNGYEPWTVIKLKDVIETLDQESPLHYGKFSRFLSSAWVRPGF